MSYAIDLVAWGQAAGRLLLPGAMLTVAIMAVVWWIHLRIKNAGIVDVAWAGNIGLLALLYATLGSGYPPRKGLIADMGLIWSARLTLHLWRRNIGKPEEGRYQALRTEWGGNIPLKFFFFFQFQTLLDLVFSLHSWWFRSTLFQQKDMSPLSFPLHWSGPDLPSGWWLWPGKHWRTVRLNGSKKTPKTGAAFARLGFGDTRATPIISSSGSPGWPSRYLPFLRRSVSCPWLVRP